MEKCATTGAFITETGLFSLVAVVPKNKSEELCSSAAIVPQSKSTELCSLAAVVPHTVNLLSCVARGLLCHKVNPPSCVARQPLCHKVNLLSCVVRRLLCHKVNPLSCVAWRPLCHKVNRSRYEARWHQTNEHLALCYLLGKTYKPAYSSDTQVTEINTLEQSTEKVIDMSTHTPLKAFMIPLKGVRGVV